MAMLRSSPLVLALALAGPAAGQTCDRTSAIADLCCASSAHSTNAGLRYFAACTIQGQGVTSSAACPPGWIYQASGQQAGMLVVGGVVVCVCKYNPKSKPSKRAPKLTVNGKKSDGEVVA